MSAGVVRGWERLLSTRQVRSHSVEADGGLTPQGNNGRDSAPPVQLLDRWLADERSTADTCIRADAAKKGLRALGRTECVARSTEGAGHAGHPFNSVQHRSQACRLPRIAAAPAVVARSRVENRASVMTIEQIAVALLMWIASHSSYPTAGRLPPPPIVLMTAEELSALVRERSGLALQDAGDQWRVYGYFSLDEDDHGTIYVPHPADTPGAELYEHPADNPIFRERLLHELVHYVQHATGAIHAFECQSRRELAAYYLGGVYLKERAVADPLPDRMFLAFWASRC